MVKTNSNKNFTDKQILDDYESNKAHRFNLYF